MSRRLTLVPWLTLLLFFLDCSFTTKDPIVVCVGSIVLVIINSATTSDHHTWRLMEKIPFLRRSWCRVQCLRIDLVSREDGNVGPNVDVFSSLFFSRGIFSQSERTLKLEGFWIDGQTSEQNRCVRRTVVRPSKRN